MPNTETPLGGQPGEPSSLTPTDRTWIAGLVHNTACNQAEVVMSFIALSNGVRTLGTACLSMFFVDTFLALTVLKNRILTPYEVIAGAQVSKGTFVVLAVFCLLALANLALAVMQPMYRRMRLWKHLRLGAVAASLVVMAVAWHWYF